MLTLWESKVADDKCDCGTALPCEYHTVTPEMVAARVALDSLTLVQRGRILCWYCPACHEDTGAKSHIEPPDYGPSCTRR